MIAAGHGVVVLVETPSGRSLAGAVVLASKGTAISKFQASDASGATQSATVKVVAGPKLGDESVGFLVTVAIGGQTMVMNGAAVRVGTAVMVVDNSLLQGQSTEINVAKLAGVLTQRVQSLGTAGPH